MRDINFRCWDTGINFMYYDPECYNLYNEVDNGLHSGYEDKYGTWHQNVLMQYTGLTDKQGVEIYEGDILVIELDWGYGLAKIYSEVYFNNGMFKSKAINSHEDVSLMEMPYLEVIGNIYENPELLETK